MDPFINACVTGLNAIGGRFCSYAGAMFLQVGVLIAVLLALDALLRRRIRATIRYWIWMLVFLKLVLPPSLSAPTGIGYWCGAHVPPAPPISIETPETMTPSPVRAEAAARPEIELPPPEGAAFDVASMPAEPVGWVLNPRVKASFGQIAWPAVIFLLWAIGVLIFAGWVVQRLLFVRRLLAQGQPAPGEVLDTLDECRRQMGIRRNVGLRLLAGTFSPAVCGLLRPTILVPTVLLERLSPENLRAILIHELAHVRRGDLWLNCLQTALQVVYFYNPLVWLANAIVRRVREQAVDEMSLVALGAEARSYGHTLIEIAEMAFLRASPALRLVGVAESKKSLEGRIKHMITRPIPKSARVGVWGLSAILSAAAVLLPMARAQDHIQQTNDAEARGHAAGASIGAQFDPNLVAWWKLDDGTGTVVKDSSGNGIDGTFVGNPMWAAGVKGGALLFDGASAVDFRTPYQTALTGSLTIACWINPQDLGAIPRVVGGSEDRAFLARDGGYAFKASGPNLRFTTPWIRDHEATNTFLTAGQWQHVAVTFQPNRVGGCVFYLNGVESDRTDASILKIGPGPVRLANNQWPGGQFYTGAMDDVRLYNCILTEDEIKRIVGGNLFAHDPQPTRDAVVPVQNVTALSWSAGDGALGHDVYLGLDEETVRAADRVSPLYWGRQSGTSFSVAGKLKVGAAHFWRIDEVEADGVTIRKGTVWKFVVSR
jgi:beta-lactamase regulating signal transducer with metallopeptidase domain